MAALGRDLTRSVDPLPRVWLLDEITSVPQWTSTLKYLRDNTLFGEDTVVCTGSSWDQVANVERDLLAGRAGRHTVRRLRLLVPMSFRDVVRATARKFPLPAVVAPWNLQGGLAKAVAVEAELFTDDLDFAWQSYLTSGGFPRAVAEHHRLGSVSDGFAHDLLAWLHRDVDAEVSNDSVALLLDGLARHSTSPLNRSAAAGELGYASRQNLNCGSIEWFHVLPPFGVHKSMNTEAKFQTLNRSFTY